MGGALKSSQSSSEEEKSRSSASASVVAPACCSGSGSAAAAAACLTISVAEGPCVGSVICKTNLKRVCWSNSASDKSLSPSTDCNPARASRSRPVNAYLHSRNPCEWQFCLLGHPTHSPRKFLTCGNGRTCRRSSPHLSREGTSGCEQDNQ